MAEWKGARIKTVAATICSSTEKRSLTVCESAEEEEKTGKIGRDDVISAAEKIGDVGTESGHRNGGKSFGAKSCERENQSSGGGSWRGRAM